MTSPADVYSFLAPLLPIDFLLSIVSEVRIYRAVPLRRPLLGSFSPKLRWFIYSARREAQFTRVCVKGKEEVEGKRLNTNEQSCHNTAASKPPRGTGGRVEEAATPVIKIQVHPG